MNEWVNWYKRKVLWQCRGDAHLNKYIPLYFFSFFYLAGLFFGDIHQVACGPGAHFRLLGSLSCSWYDKGEWMLVVKFELCMAAAFMSVRPHYSGIQWTSLTSSLPQFTLAKCSRLPISRLLWMGKNWLDWSPTVRAMPQTLAHWFVGRQVNECTTMIMNGIYYYFLDNFVQLEGK